MLIVAATLAVLVYGLIAPMLGALLPSYHLTADQNGVLAMVNAFGLVIASLAAGPVIDKRGHKPALLTGLFLVTAALFAAPNAGGYSGLLIVYFALAFGGGIVVTGSNSLVGAIEPTRRAAALNFLNLFFGLGGILTTYAASHIFTPVALCYSVASLTLLALIVNAVANMPAASGISSFNVAEISSLISSPALLLLSFFMFLYVACEVGVWNWLNSYLQNSRGFTSADAGGVVAYGFAFGILVGRIVVSRILAKIPALTVLFFSAILIAITTFLMLRLSSQNAITIAVFFTGVSMAPVFPTTLGVVGDTFRRGTATATGIVITCGWLGLALSSPIIGAIAKNSNLGKALLLIPVFAAVMIVVNLVLRSATRRPVTA